MGLPWARRPGRVVQVPHPLPAPRGASARAPRSAAHRSSIWPKPDGASYVKDRPSVDPGWRVALAHRGLPGGVLPRTTTCSAFAVSHRPDGFRHHPVVDMLQPTSDHGVRQVFAGLGTCPYRDHASSLAHHPSAFVPLLSNRLAVDPLDLRMPRHVVLEVLIRAESWVSRVGVNRPSSPRDAPGLSSPMATHA